MIRFDKELLARVDKAARRRGVNRSAWISYVISQALETE
jgi:metal-responsive CopG/Arc/MetJ family transcriptional regulator